MSTQCPKCNSKNTATARFCSDCGTQLISQKDIPAQTITIETPVQELIRGTLFAGRYEIIEELGTGGMGKVYRVEDMKAKEEIALKLIRPEIAADKKTIERFRNELTIARKIRHKNICGMYDLGEDKGSYYITMEYVPGEDLKSFLRRSKKLTVETTVSIGIQICDGLSEAHRMGVIHRDLKPSNIMIDREGNVRIMDFGIARSLSTKGITGAGVMIGTPEYMSPEQVEGKELDQRSDIWSLGVVLYEMLTGQLPFKSEQMQGIVYSILNKKPASLSSLRSNIPRNIEQAVIKAMEKDVDVRFQNIQELIENLKKPGPITSPKAEKSIAVLSFKNMSADPEQEYFCEGMAEEIINSLTQIKDLKVAARSSAFTFKGKEADIREIGRKLNVDKILEGSVRKVGNRLRIMAQLINVEDGYHLWSERYDREMEDVFAIQDEITIQIISALKMTFGEQKLRSKRHTDNLEAYHLYLKGRHFWHRRQPAAIRKALEIYQLAAEKDPSYALAQAGLAWIYCILGLYGLFPQEQAYAKVKEATEQAINLDDSLGDVQIALWSINIFYEWDWKEAERAIKRAIELETGNVEAHCFYGLLLACMGRRKEAFNAVRRAQELDPLSTYASTLVGMVLLMGRENENAILEFQKALEIEPDFVLALYYLSGAYVRASRYQEAIAVAEKVVKLTRRAPIYLAWLGWIYGAGRERDSVRNVLRELMERSKKEYISPLFISWILSELTEEGDAFEWLEKAFKERSPFIAFWRLPVFDSLSSDPRFKALLKKIGLDK